MRSTTSPKRSLLIAVILTVLVSSLTLLPATRTAAQTNEADARWFQIDTDVLKSGSRGADDFAQSFVNVINKAGEDGYRYNGVVLRGAPINAMGADTGWQNRIDDIVVAAKANRLEVIVALGSIGRCNSLLTPAKKYDLATAYPVTMRMEAAGNGVLGANGTFNPGPNLTDQVLTESRPSAVAFMPQVERGGQYRVTVSFKSEQLQDDNVRVFLRAEDMQQPRQVLTRLDYAKPVPRPNLTAGTITMAFNSFKSTSVRATLTATGLQGTGESLTITSWKVERAPTLNAVSRDGKIGAATALSVDVYRGGAVVDTLTIANERLSLAGSTDPGADDPGLGTPDPNVNSWQASQAIPELRILGGVPTHDALVMRGWHALPFKKVVSCSWNDDAVATLIADVAEYAVNDLKADRIIIPFDEIDSGGAEPEDGWGQNTSAALTSSIEGITKKVKERVGKPIAIYSDMFDRNTNARPCYVHVVGSLVASSPVSVPSDVTVLFWDTSDAGDRAHDRHNVRSDKTCGAIRADKVGTPQDPEPGRPPFDIARHRAAGLKNIAGLSQSQMIAAYYDTDAVAMDYDDWQAAISATSGLNVTGTFYATWERPSNCPSFPVLGGQPGVACVVETDDNGSDSRLCRKDLEQRGCVYEHLEEFADQWFDEDDGAPEGDLTAIVNGTSVSAEWTLPNDPQVNGAWLYVQGITGGEWYKKGTTTGPVHDNLPDGDYTLIALATIGGGNSYEFARDTFTIGNDPEPEGDLTAIVNGTSVSAEWTLPNDPQVNGTWIYIQDRAGGKWYQKGTTTGPIADNLPNGDYTLIALATIGGGNPYEFARDTFTIAGTAALCNGETPTLTGTAASETLKGTAGRDVIFGGGGDDVIFGLGGDDVICGGTGDDSLFGQDGSDDLFGGPGNDSLYGGDDIDDLYGGSGLDGLWGGDGADMMYGGSEKDMLVGGNGDDELFGGPGADDLFGGPNNDRLNGGPDGGDVCDGESGFDTHVANCETLVSVP